ncbi:hypothetical protein PUN28_019922 [Cardiocondyla obscurior]|uniref:Uncharacterized protein n=1 Tax=Cardiocondyla obscurior TaxID=286306 RepID=A0AAW2E836_9HYME
MWQFIYRPIVILENRTLTLTFRKRALSSSYATRKFVVPSVNDTFFSSFHTFCLKGFLTALLYIDYFSRSYRTKFDFSLVREIVRGAPRDRPDLASRAKKNAKCREKVQHFRERLDGNAQTLVSCKKFIALSLLPHMFTDKVTRFPKKITATAGQIGR